MRDIDGLGSIDVVIVTYIDSRYKRSSQFGFVSDVKYSLICSRD